MPVHDWTRVNVGIFHSFHTSWITHLMETLNAGLLPPGYYALSEQATLQSQTDTGIWHNRGRNVVIRHVSRYQVVAVLEISSHSNEGRSVHIWEMAENIVLNLKGGIHVLLIDLLPPTRYEPQGIHGAVWKYFDRFGNDVPSDKPLTLVSYVWDGSEPEAFIEPVSVGQRLIDMPLFLTAERYVNVPLEQTYLAAFRGMPEFWRDILESQDSDHS